MGRYPKKSIEIGTNRLIVTDDLVLSLVRVLPPRRHGIGIEHHSELESLQVEEIRFLSCLSLALQPDQGMVYCYPFPFEEPSEEPDLEQLVPKALDAAHPKGRYGQGLVLPPAIGGPAYEWHHVDLDDRLFRRLIRKVSLRDHLLLRGLGALLRADMAMSHRELADTACMQLYVALEVSFRMVLRELHRQGCSNPTAMDAGAYLDLAFNPHIDTGSYFAEFYEDRIKAFHPESRFGTFAFTPLSVDDFYWLRSGMMEVYPWLICGHRWEGLWR